LSTDATERILTLPVMGVKNLAAHSLSVSLDYSPSSDEELLELVRHRNEAALLTLFQRYNRLTFAIGCRILRDPGEAEDLVQEVFLRLHSRENTFDASKGSARTWLVQMVYRRAFDRRAYLHRRHFYHGTDEAAYANAVSGAKSLETDVVERLTAQQLRAAFSELTDNQRATLEQYFFEGLKLGEIAERSGEDLKNVRHHYYRGLERLRQLAREMIRDEGGHEGDRKGEMG
jgi:RNA polymerase sigma-70 factor (ECF subfamily)